MSVLEVIVLATICLTVGIVIGTVVALSWTAPERKGRP